MFSFHVVSQFKWQDLWPTLALVLGAPLAWEFKESRIREIKENLAQKLSLWRIFLHALEWCLLFCAGLLILEALMATGQAD